MGLGRSDRAVHCVEGSDLRVSVRSVLPFPILAAPARVAPTAATEQKHYQQNDQYGFHVVPHFKRKLD